MGYSIEDADNVHVELWQRRRIDEMMFRASAFYGRMNKASDLAFDGIHVPLQYGGPQGRSRNFARAKANADGLKFAKWYIQPSDDHCYFTIDDKLLKSNQTSEAFLVDVLDRLTKGSLGGMVQNQARLVWGTGTHERGQIATGGITESGGNTTIVLAVDADISQFEEGMFINAGASLTGALRGSAAAYKVIRVDLNAGSFVVEGTAATTSSWAAGDYLWQDGDALNGVAVSATNMPVYGFQAYIPTTAPTPGESFQGQDRSVDVAKLAGHRFTAAALGTTTIASTVLKACGRMTRAGDIVRMYKPTDLYMHGEDFTDMLEELEQATSGRGVVQSRDDVGDRTTGTIYYDAVQIKTALGTINAMIDDSHPKGKASLVNPDTWTYHTIGEGASFVDEDGSVFHRLEGGMEYEARGRVYPQVTCTAPVGNATITLPV